MTMVEVVLILGVTGIALWQNSTLMGVAGVLGWCLMAARWAAPGNMEPTIIGLIFAVAIVIRMAVSGFQGSMKP